MTAIGDKLKEVDPMRALGAEFYARATDALRKHNSVREALRVMDNWLVVQLTRIRTDMESKELGGHGALDAHGKHASQAGASGGHPSVDTHGVPATARSTPAAKIKPFFPQKDKSEAEKKIVRDAQLTGSPFWHEYKMAGLRIEELGSFVRDQIIAGGNHALAAKWETERAAIAWQILKHAQFPDGKMLVRDCVSDKAMGRFVANAKRQASLIVAKIVAHTVEEIDRGVKLIAAE